MNGDRHVVYSIDETMRQQEPMFWSNENGWGSLQSATVFATEDTVDTNLPMPDGEWAVLPPSTTHENFFASLSEEEQLWLLEVAHTALDWSDMQERIGSSMDLADEPLEVLHAKIGVYLANNQ